MDTLSTWVMVCYKIQVDRDETANKWEFKFARVT